MATRTNVAIASAGSRRDKNFPNGFPRQDAASVRGSKAGFRVKTHFCASAAAKIGASFAIQMSLSMARGSPATREVGSDLEI